ncbi:hypothetical protein DFA_01953 [Cavenderia fasciculata]|uniref:Uncharacterized protein n=1 Tax=Cavenderia fasciculata TaxID=261658 RepID=F4PR06_CACFS|nr:uncharacterized protein DFA_01953 [Cavenderia fasciculata]EGG22063.1 hypothetical protein DFA_01953 [Cavenderia fasciculata]|eukprot:XP_004359914.1 hypothetical protein DFA_01953 [Cavenderia fasciculata]
MMDSNNSNNSDNSIKLPIYLYGIVIKYLWEESESLKSSVSRHWILTSLSRVSKQYFEIVKLLNDKLIFDRLTLDQLKKDNQNDQIQHCSKQLLLNQLLIDLNKNNKKENNNNNNNDNNDNNNLTKYLIINIMSNDGLKEFKSLNVDGQMNLKRFIFEQLEWDDKKRKVALEEEASLKLKKFIYRPNVKEQVLTDRSKLLVQSIFNQIDTFNGVLEDIDYLISTDVGCQMPSLSRLHIMHDYRNSYGDRVWGEHLDNVVIAIGHQIEELSLVITPRIPVKEDYQEDDDNEEENEWDPDIIAVKISFSEYLSKLRKLCLGTVFDYTIDTEFFDNLTRNLPLLESLLLVEAKQPVLPRIFPPTSSQPIIDYLKRSHRLVEFGIETQECSLSLHNTKLLEFLLQDERSSHLQSIKLPVWYIVPIRRPINRLDLTLPNSSAKSRYVKLVNIPLPDDQQRKMIAESFSNVSNIIIRSTSDCSLFVDILNFNQNSTFKSIEFEFKKDSSQSTTNMIGFQQWNNLKEAIINHHNIGYLSVNIAGIGHQQLQHLDQEIQKHPSIINKSSWNLNVYDSKIIPFPPIPEPINTPIFNFPANLTFTSMGSGSGNSNNPNYTLPFIIPDQNN